MLAGTKGNSKTMKEMETEGEGARTPESNKVKPNILSGATSKS